jgi:HD-like signal output (HDOD) protein/DNA-binding response OmpR family regulator
MDKPSETGINALEKSVILLFSMRERIVNVLNVALMQCNYRIILANTSYLAMIKANQFLPDMVIIDITPNNTKDTLLVTRLKKSSRTKNIPILVIMPKTLRHFLDEAMKETEPDPVPSEAPIVSMLEYPFNFADLLRRVESILSHLKQVSIIVNKQGTDMQTAETVVAPQLFNLQVPAATKLKSIESVIQRQWAFPFTVIKALDIIGSAASCCSELAKCIETDPAASTALIKVANAVYYAKRESRVTEVQEAVVRLGFRETNNLLACLALISLSPESRKNYGFKREEFWLHSLATGLIAEKLCTQCGHHKPELAFIAGLIHDLGKIPLDNNFESVFPQLLEETTNGVSAFYKAEEHLMGFSHAALGHYLTSQWNFPTSICLAILYHHDPDMIHATPTPSDRIIQESVFVANILGKAMYLGHSCDEICEEIPETILKELKIPSGPNSNFFSSIFRDLLTFCKYLNLSSKTLAVGKVREEGPESDIIVVYNKRTSFHPIVSALRNNGFNVKTTIQFSPEFYRQARIVIFIPEKGFPMDIMFFEDDKEKAESSSVLKIFLLNALPKKSGFPMENDMLFFDRKNLDLRFVLHALDNFLGKVVTPEKQNIDSPENGPIHE